MRLKWGKSFIICMILWASLFSIFGFAYLIYPSIGYHLLVIGMGLSWFLGRLSNL
jgi:hypothetical protein